MKGMARTRLTARVLGSAPDKRFRSINALSEHETAAEIGKCRTNGIVTTDQNEYPDESFQSLFISYDIDDQQIVHDGSQEIDQGFDGIGGPN